MHTKYSILHAKIFFSKNVCLRTKFDLRLKKKQKNFWAKFSKLLCVAIKKKCQSYTFHIWELYDKHFFQKKRKPQFLSPDCFIRIKQPQKRVYTSFQPFLEIV